MESGDIKTIRRDVDALKKSVEEIMANMNNLEILKALLCHRPGPDPEGELSDWAKRELRKARSIPESELVPLDEVEAELMKNGL